MLCINFHNHNISMAMAMPMPPPMHNDATPFLPPVRFNA